MKKKKIFTGILTAAILTGVAAAIIIAVRVTTGRQKVIVVRASELNYGGYYDMGEQLEGYVTSDVSQDVYLSEMEKVSEVLVQEGDSVRTGDVLLVYDSEQTEINLEKEKLNRELILLNIQTAEENLKILDSISPVSEGGWEGGDNGGDYGGEDIPELEEESNAFSLPAEVQAQSVLDENSVAWFDENGEDLPGTIGNPYRYLCRNGARIEASFFRSLRAEAEALRAADPSARMYIALEIRSGDQPQGKLLKVWLQEAGDLPDPPDGWVGRLALAEDSTEPEEPETEEPDTEEPDTEEPDTEEPGTGSGETEASNPPGEDQGGQAEPEVPAAYSMPDTAGMPGYGTGSMFLVCRRITDGYGRDVTASGLIPKDSVYTASELKKAKQEVQEELKDLQLDLRESELAVARAQRAVDEGVVRAKLDGVVKKAGDPDNPPMDGSPFLSVSGAAGQYIRGGIKESLLDLVKEGSRLSVMSWQTGSTYEAVIRDISPYPDESGYFWSDGTESIYPFTAVVEDPEAEFSENDWLQLTLTGDSGDTEAEPAEGEDGLSDGGEAGRLYLWKAFIREEDGRYYVFKRDENDLLARQYITIGHRDGDGWEILSGVTQEDWLAFPYGKDVREGARTREGTVEELYLGV